MIRLASPSTIAVLPTPGSPISTGLFLVRRDSTWMTRRISSSRPMTGSSLPSRAASVRSRPYLASAWYVCSGSADVTRWLPRTARSAVRRASTVTPISSAIASRRCSTETYSSPSSRRRSSAASRMRRVVARHEPAPPRPGPAAGGPAGPAPSRSTRRGPPRPARAGDASWSPAAAAGRRGGGPGSARGCWTTPRGRWPR